MFKQKQIYLLIALCAGLCFFSSGRVQAVITECPADTMLCGPIVANNDNLKCDKNYFIVGNSTLTWYYNNIKDAFAVCVGTSETTCFNNILSDKISPDKIVNKKDKTPVSNYYNYKKELLNKIKGKIPLEINTDTPYGASGVVNRYAPLPIAYLQEKVLKLSGGGVDCKFGLGTMTAFINTSFCPVYKVAYEDKILDFSNKFVCPDLRYEVTNDNTIASNSYGGKSMCCTKEKPLCATIGADDGYTIDPQTTNKCLDTQESKTYGDITCCKEKPVVPEQCIANKPCGGLDIEGDSIYSEDSNLTITVTFSCLSSTGETIENFIDEDTCNLIKLNDSSDYVRNVANNVCVLTLTSDQLIKFNKAVIDVEVAIDKIAPVECTDYAGTKTIPYIGNAPAPAACTVAWTGGKCDVADQDKWEQDKRNNPTCCRKACKAGESRMKNGVIDEVNGKCTCDPNIKVNGKPQCCGVKLNTIVPFIGDCIEMSNTNTVDLSDPNKTTVNQLNAFPILMGGLTKILVTVILIVSFLMIVVGGALMTFGETKVGSEGGYKQGIKILGRVIAAIALLGVSGIILKLINPTFFG